MTHTKDSKTAEGFLGLTGYYRKFVKGYGIISKPLTSLLKKDKFKWGDEAEHAFLALKKAMTTTPVLSIPDFTKPFVLETDASGYGIGVGLMQEGRPIAYMSKTLCPKNQALSVYEREFLAVVMVIQKWRNYLSGHKFIIRTDQQALKYLLDQKTMSPVQQKRITKLLGLDYDIQYRKGTENRAVDALSRMQQKEDNCFAITTVAPTCIQQVISSYDNDTYCSKLLSDLANDPLSHPNFTLDSGLLRYKGRAVVGQDDTLKLQILTTMHSSAYGGHSGVNGTYMRLKSVFFWPKMKEGVVTMVRTCEVCHRNKNDTGSKAELLQPLPIPDEAWTHISLDFIEGLPMFGGKNVILVVIDRFTKYGHFLALSHPFTAQGVAKLFLDQVYKLHGLPVSILTDRDKIITSQFWKELFKVLGVTLNLTTAYHPQSDGQTERLNQCLENYLRCMTSSAPKQWSKWLSLAEYWYNTNYHTALKVTPFQALYGYAPNYLSMKAYIDTDSTEVKEVCQQRRLIMRSLKENLQAAQNRMKCYADKNRKDKQFEVGDMVYLKLQPYRQNSVELRRNLKLSSRYFGPYEVIAKVGQVAYKLKLPDGSKIHPVFHVSLLKKQVKEECFPALSLPVSTDEGLFTISPTAVLGTRTITRGKETILQMLVRWGEAELGLSSWEDKNYILAKFSNFDPCGQGSQIGGSIVVNRNSEEIKEPQIQGFVGSMEGEELVEEEEVVKLASLGFDEMGDNLKERDSSADEITVVRKMVNMGLIN